MCCSTGNVKDEDFASFNGVAFGALFALFWVSVLSEVKNGTDEVVFGHAEELC